MIPAFQTIYIIKFDFRKSNEEITEININNLLLLELENEKKLFNIKYNKFNIRLLYYITHFYNNIRFIQISCTAKRMPCELMKFTIHSYHIILRIVLLIVISY